MQSIERLRSRAAIFQWNARGLRNRLSNFCQFVFKYCFPVIAISESRVGSDIRLSGYELFYSQRRSGLSRVLLGIRTDLTFFLHTVAPHQTNEYIAASVRKGAITFTIIAAYIPPGKAFDKLRLEEIIKKTPSPHILTGDFNSHHPMWGGRKANTRGRALVDLADKYNLTILNDGSPTYFKGVTMSSPLDISLASADLAIKTSWLADIETHGSDHVPTYITINKFCCIKLGTSLSYTNWEKFQEKLETKCHEIATTEDLAHVIASAKSEATKS